jgi:hypothetical protein
VQLAGFKHLPAQVGAVQRAQHRVELFLQRVRVCARGCVCVCVCVCVCGWVGARACVALACFSQKSATAWATLGSLLGACDA